MTATLAPSRPTQPPAPGLGGLEQAWFSRSMLDKLHAMWLIVELEPSSKAALVTARVTCDRVQEGSGCTESSSAWA